MHAKCPFCLDEKSSDEIIFESKHTYVIHDQWPFAQGHLLAIPKKHHKNIMEMSDEELYDIMKTIKEMEKRLVERMEVKGITIRQNWIPFVKNNPLVVEHVHFHIIPRHLNDRLAVKIERMKMSAEEIRHIARKLK